MRGAIIGIVSLGFALPAFSADNTASLIQQADAFYAQRSDVEQNLKALALYEKAIQITPDDASLYWKAARASWWAGTRTKGLKNQTPLFEKGIEFGKKAVEKKPDAVEPHFWLGSNYASYANGTGAFTSLKLIKKVREEMTITQKMDASYLYGGADRVLGILDYKVPGIVGGNRKRALEELKKALTFAPEHPVTRFYIADYYAAGKEYGQARKELEALSRIAVPSDLEPEFKIIQPEREELAKKLASH